MAWLVRFTREPRYLPEIRLPPENARFFVDAAWRLKYEAHAYDPALAPKRVLYTSGGKTIPDFVPIHARFGLCQEARDLVEAFEPGVHQLLPVEVVRPRSTRPIHRPDGRVLDTPYYIFNIMTVLDAVWIERSKVRVHRTENAPKPVPPLVHLLPSTYDIVLRREITQGHHVWRGGRHLNGSYFFSDALMEEVQKRKLRKLDVHYVEEA